jgi:hypothetical protein
MQETESKHLEGCRSNLLGNIIVSLIENKRLNH